MRKIPVVFMLVLLSACQGISTAQPPIQTAPQVDLTSTPLPAESTATPNPIVPIPVTSIQIEGVSYQAYQIPGDSFRFVCQEPCPLDPQYIFAEYAGFRPALASLIKLTGVDTLTELQPVDMHLVLEDSVCNDAPYGHASIYSDTHKAYTCTEGPGYYPTVEEKIQKAAQPEEQYFPLHEYMHTIFFGRISGQAGSFSDYKAAFFHDFVVPLPSYAVGFLDPTQFCSYQDVLAPGDYSGWLIHELCQQNGFELPDLALSLIELDKLVQSGGGQISEEGYAHPVPSVAQYRDILNHLLGSDTTQAFADACWPPELFANSYSLTGVCAVAPITGTPTPLN
jgi:hypothetical protein